ncbi:NmrA family transcriptional regulator [Streptomyces tateyamensis]|uniref:NmrA family transcriptional regulator n=1 Tax=Streptomyces tateyamensis TaxID=565073 RepID=A0A2V4PKH5_9ACTN|nr:NAD(P)H-binding protein [Streptomyces tateyamensis]PYC84719.1 NmrA family transcriptional regulator [Streptomyces tateyamensis]
MIMVTGATGNVGREVVKLLAGQGAAVAAVSRNPAPAQPPAPAPAPGAFADGVRQIVGDPSRPQSLAPALGGVAALLLSPRAVGGASAELLALAAERGVRRVVVLSAVTVEYGGGYRRFAEEFAQVEAAARASGLSWTFLRCADFAANALAWAPQIRATGRARGVHGAAATSPVHQRDIAEVAVQALLDPGSGPDAAHAGRAYALRTRPGERPEPARRRPGTHPPVEGRRQGTAGRRLTAHRSCACGVTAGLLVPLP